MTNNEHPTYDYHPQPPKSFPSDLMNRTRKGRRQQEQAQRISHMTNEEELAALAHHALLVLKEFPRTNTTAGGSLTPLEVDALAVAAYRVLGLQLPEWRRTDL